MEREAVIAEAVRALETANVYLLDAEYAVFDRGPFGDRYRAKIKAIKASVIDLQAEMRKEVENAD